MKSWIMLNVECRIGCGNQREKDGILWSFQCPLPYHFLSHPLSPTWLPGAPCTCFPTHLSSWTLSPPHRHIGMHRLAQMCAHIPCMSQICARVRTQTGISRGGAEWIGASVGAGQQAHWLGEGTCG